MSYDETVQLSIKHAVRKAQLTDLNRQERDRLIALLDRCLERIEPLNMANCLVTEEDADEDEGAEQKAEQAKKMFRIKPGRRPQKPKREQIRVPQDVVQTMISVANAIGSGSLVRKYLWTYTQHAHEACLRLQERVYARTGIQTTGEDECEP